MAVAHLALDLGSRGERGDGVDDDEGQCTRPDQLGQGKENARRYLKENPSVRDEIERKILDKLNIGAGAEIAEIEAESDEDAPIDVVPVEF